MTITLNTLSGSLLISISFNLFLRVCLVLSFGTYSFVSSFCLTFCVCFYMLHRSATSPGLERVALCRRYPVGPSSMVSLGYQGQMLQECPLCGLHVSSCCGSAALAEGVLVCKAGPHCGWLQGPVATVVGALVCGADPWGRSHFGGTLVLAKGVPQV